MSVARAASTTGPIPTRSGVGVIPVLPCPDPHKLALTTRG